MDDFIQPAFFLGFENNKLFGNRVDLFLVLWSSNLGYSKQFLIDLTELRGDLVKKTLPDRNLALKSHY